MRTKFLMLALAMALVFSTMVPSIASAQMYGETLHLSLMGGYLFPNNRINVRNGFVAGVGLGYNFNRNWGLEAFGYFAPNLNDDRYDVVRYDNDVTMARLSALYHFDLNSNFVPYLSLGVGGNWISRDNPGWNDYSSFALTGGIGFKYFFNEVVALRVEVNDSYGFSSKQGNRFNAPMVSAGLTFQVGAPSECIDSDHDGVCDAYDKCPGTPAGYKVDADGCPITVTINMDIKFDFDKAVVKKRYLGEVQKVADFLNSHPGSEAVIEGHTDAVGNDEYNQELSERRAKAVYDVLVNAFGVSSSKIQWAGYGESRPIADNETAEGRALNRRVVGVFTGSDIIQ
ncbi:MAG: OmpA family protein [Deltaproteobacteria bacterium]|nr:OmpA family protein [Deltaproteobacteria bacterium]